jgi:hypothetical protein
MYQFQSKYPNTKFDLLILPTDPPDGTQTTRIWFTATGTKDGAQHSMTGEFSLPDPSMAKSDQIIRDNIMYFSSGRGQHPWTVTDVIVTRVVFKDKRANELVEFGRDDQPVSRDDHYC